jgi:CheY-specific phosphatase CheX
MLTERSTALSDVFSHVLEQAAFMFAESAEKGDLPEAHGPCHEAMMSFYGAMEGDLVLAATENTGRTIAANSMGVDREELPDQAGQDALKELLNVTCGNLLIALAGEEPVFDLLPPVVCSIDADEWAALAANDDTVCFTVEGEPVLMHLKIKA